MSEIATESAAPQTTADIAAQVMDSYEHNDDVGAETGVSAGTETSTTETPVVEAAAPVEQPTEAELTAAAKFLLAQGHKARKEDGRDNWLPVKTVEKMLDRYVETHRGEWNGAKTTLESERNTYRDQLEQLRREVQGDPRAFLAELASVDERYKAFLEASQPREQARPQVDLSRMPDGDLDLGNGARSFTLDGIKNTLVPWIVANVEAGLLPKVDERLKPYDERVKADQERSAIEQRQSALREKVSKTLETAATWPNWAEYKDDIFKALQEDQSKSMTLREAYLEVKTNRQRAEILKELQGAPKAPAIGRRGDGTPSVPSGASTRDIAAQVLAEASRRA